MLASNLHRQRHDKLIAAKGALADNEPRLRVKLAERNTCDECGPNGENGQDVMTLGEALTNARRWQVAIGHFNVSDLVALKAVTETARELKTPIIIGTSEG